MLFPCMDIFLGLSSFISRFCNERIFVNFTVLVQIIISALCTSPNVTVPIMTGIRIERPQPAVLTSDPFSLALFWSANAFWTPICHNHWEGHVIRPYRWLHASIVLWYQFLASCCLLDSGQLGLGIVVVVLERSGHDLLLKCLLIVVHISILGIPDLGARWICPWYNCRSRSSHIHYGMAMTWGKQKLNIFDIHKSMGTANRIHWTQLSA